MYNDSEWAPQYPHLGSANLWPYCTQAQAEAAAAPPLPPSPASAAAAPSPPSAAAVACWQFALFFCSVSSLQAGAKLSFYFTYHTEA